MLQPEDYDNMAFEFVLGTLPVSERTAFEQELEDNIQLRDKVNEWEEKLIGLTAEVVPVAPSPSTFEKIQSRINPASSPSQIQESNNPIKSFWDNVLPWKLISGFAFTLLFAVGLLNYHSVTPSHSLNADYLAVLLNSDDKPILTAVTGIDDNQLWLTWEQWSLPKDQSIQIWAKSKRDGQVRPLLVVNQPLQSIRLDEATLRLIKDSSHLILTQEESGGSAIDEPSDKVIATGVCIRLKAVKNQA